jgi:hypothetical protein
MEMTRKPSPELVARLRAELLPKTKPPKPAQPPTAQEVWEQRQRQVTPDQFQNLHRQAKWAAEEETWARREADRREYEAECARSCHVGPGDPDYRGRR